MTAGQIKSARRVIELFEMFASIQRPLTVTEISKQLVMPQSSTSELLQLLVALDYLGYDTESRTFFPTLRISFLSSWINSSDEQSSKLPELVMKVAEQVNETVSLAMRNGIHAHYVLVHNAPQELTQAPIDPDALHIRSGYLKPLCCCASGWALLGLESDLTIERLVRRTVTETTSPLWKRTASCAPEEVRLYRSRGFAHSRGQGVEGIAGLSIRLPRSEHRPPLAATVSGPIERIEEKKDLVLQCLRTLNAKLSSELEVVSAHEQDREEQTARLEKSWPSACEKSNGLR